MSNYYSRPEVSNSDLTALKKALYGGQDFDPKEAYKFGSLIDAMITEPDLVDEYGLSLNGETYAPEQFEQAKQMRRAFLKDELCNMILQNSEMQRVMVMDDMRFDYHVPFSLPVRCKWDLWQPKYNWGGDIKSTAATTQEQFVAACKHFDYDRQRWWYMNIAGSDRDMLIGISKVNFKVFKFKIEKGDEFYKSGERKALELAFRYWLYFGNSLKKAS